MRQLLLDIEGYIFYLFIWLAFQNISYNIMFTIVSKCNDMILFA